MKILYIFTAVCLAASLLKSRKKTMQALVKAIKKFEKMIPPFLIMIIAVSVALYFLSDKVLLTLLDNSNKSFSVMLASILGSITMMPGFITFPLCGLLLEKGVSYTVLSAFTTTLMMVGVLTYPIEKAYLGRRVAILRNLIGFTTALIVAAATGIVFGEIF